jgi:hypothetical protein
MRTSLELETERAVKEGIVGEDDLPEVLANGPTRDQGRGYLFRAEHRRAREVASLERGRVRRIAARHAGTRRQGVLHLFCRNAD